MRVLTSDVTKVFLYLLACFFLAALLTPWLYNAGTFLSELAEEGTRNQVVDWLGEKCRGATLPAFFRGALLLSALLLVLPLIFSLHMRSNPAPLRESPWSVYLPSRAVACTGGQPLRNPRHALLHLLAGLLLAAGLLFATGWLVVSLGWFTLNTPLPWGSSLKSALVPTLTGSVLGELVFRGVLLGVFLRTFRPSIAILLLSFVFAALYFAQPPNDVAVFSRGAAVPEGTIFIDPSSPASGFQLLQAIGLRFQQLDLVLYEFLYFLTIGLILGFARHATASLWLPIGLHAGWILASTTFAGLATRTPDPEQNLNFLIGSNLKEGVVPLVTLAVTGFLVFLLSRMLRPAPPRHHHGPGALAAGPA